MNVSLATPVKPLFDLGVRSLKVITINGEACIGEHHAPLLTELCEGILSLFLLDGSSVHYYLGGGFLKIDQVGSVRIAADVAETAEQVDFERAAAAEKRAQQRLKEQAKGDIDINRAFMSLRRAQARLRLRALWERSKS